MRYARLKVPSREPRDVTIHHDLASPTRALRHAVTRSSPSTNTASPSSKTAHALCPMISPDTTESSAIAEPAGIDEVRHNALRFELHEHVAKTSARIHVGHSLNLDEPVRSEHVNLDTASRLACELYEAYLVLK